MASFPDLTALGNMSEEEFNTLYQNTRKANKPVDISSFLYQPPPPQATGLVKGALSGLGRGVGGAVKQMGQAIQGVPTEVDEQSIHETLGGALSSAGSKMRDWIPQPIAESGSRKESLFAGAESLVPSLAMGLPAVAGGIIGGATTFGAGAPVGAAAGGALTYPLMQRASAREAYETIKKHRPDIPEDKALQIANEYGNWEAGPEAVGNIAEGALMGMIPGGRAIKTGVDVIKALYKPGIKQLAKNIAISAPFESGTEAITGYQQAKLLKDQGVVTEYTDPVTGELKQINPWEEAAKGAESALYMGGAMGGMGLAGQRLRGAVTQKQVELGNKAFQEPLVDYTRQTLGNETADILRENLAKQKGEFELTEELFRKPAPIVVDNKTASDLIQPEVTERGFTVAPDWVGVKSEGRPIDLTEENRVIENLPAPINIIPEQGGGLSSLSQGGTLARTGNLPATRTVSGQVISPATRIGTLPTGISDIEDAEFRELASDIVNTKNRISELKSNPAIGSKGLVLQLENKLKTIDKNIPSDRKPLLLEYVSSLEPSLSQAQAGIGLNLKEEKKKGKGIIQKQITPVNAEIEGVENVTENIQGLPSEIGVRQEPIPTRLIERPSEEAVSPSGNVQADGTKGQVGTTKVTPKTAQFFSGGERVVKNGVEYKVDRISKSGEVIEAFKIKKDGSIGTKVFLNTEKDNLELKPKKEVELSAVKKDSELSFEEFSKRHEESMLRNGFSRAELPKALKDFYEYTKEQEAKLAPIKESAGVTMPSTEIAPESKPQEAVIRHKYQGKSVNEFVSKLRENAKRGFEPEERIQAKAVQKHFLDQSMSKADRDAFKRETEELLAEEKTEVPASERIAEIQAKQNENRNALGLLDEKGKGQSLEAEKLRNENSLLEEELDSLEESGYKENRIPVGTDAFKGATAAVAENTLRDEVTTVNTLANKAHLARIGKEDGIEIIAMNMKGEKSELLSKIAKTLGRRIVFFMDKRFQSKELGAKALLDVGVLPNGFVLSESPNTIYVNINSTAAGLYVLGHEVFHTLRMESTPTFMSDLESQLRPFLKAKEYQQIVKLYKDKQVLGNLSEKGVKEELFANLMGEMFVRGDVWKDLAKENPSLFNQIAKAALKIIAKIKTLITSNTTNDIVKDIASVEKILKNLLKEDMGFTSKDAYRENLASDVKEVNTLLGNNKGSIQVAPEYLVNAVKKLYNTTKNVAEFTKGLVERFGNEIKKHAIKLYNWAKQKGKTDDLRLYSREHERAERSSIQPMENKGIGKYSKSAFQDKEGKDTSGKYLERDGERGVRSEKVSTRKPLSSYSESERKGSEFYKELSSELQKRTEYSRDTLSSMSADDILRFFEYRVSTDSRVKFTGTRLKKSNETPSGKISGLAKLFNKKVVFLEDISGELDFQGFMFFSKGQDTIFINKANSDVSLPLFGHELMHFIELDHPNLYKDFVEVVKSSFNEKQWVESFGLIYDPLNQQNYSELSADMFGNLFQTQSFWDKVGKKNPTLLEKIVSWIKDLLVKISKNPMNFSNEFVTDLEKIEDAAVTAFNEYAKREGIKTAIPEIKQKQEYEDNTFAPSSEDIKYSRNIKSMAEDVSTFASDYNPFKKDVSISETIGRFFGENLQEKGLLKQIWNNIIRTPWFVEALRPSTQVYSERVENRTYNYKKLLGEINEGNIKLKDIATDIDKMQPSDKDSLFKLLVYGDKVGKEFTSKPEMFSEMSDKSFALYKEMRKYMQEMWKNNLDAHAEAQTDIITGGKESTIKDLRPAIQKVIQDKDLAITTKKRNELRQEAIGEANAGRMVGSLRKNFIKDYIDSRIEKPILDALIKESGKTESDFKPLMTKILDAKREYQLQSQNYSEKGLQGYIPRTRLDGGEFKVEVFKTAFDKKGEPIKNKKVFSRFFNTQRDAIVFARQLKENPAFQEKHLPQSIAGLKENEEILWDAVTPEQIVKKDYLHKFNYEESFKILEQQIKEIGEQVGITDAAKKKLITELKQAMTTRLLVQQGKQNRVRRKKSLVEGYEENNPIEAVNTMITRTANALARVRYVNDQLDVLSKAEDKDKSAISDYITQSMKPMTEWQHSAQKVKNFTAIYFMGFRPLTALIQLTQLATIVAADLGMFAKKAGIKTPAHILLTKAASDAMFEKNLTENEKYVLRKADELGETFQNSSQTALFKGLDDDNVKELVDSKLQSFANKGMWMFTQAETMNRKTAILASFRVFTAQGLSRDEAFKKAIEFNNTTNFMMSKGNVPKLFQNAPGMLAYSLMSYTMNMMNWIFNRAYGKATDKDVTKWEQRQAALRLLGFSMVLGGVTGAPFADDLNKLLRKFFGKDLKFETEQFLRKNVGKDITAAIIDGVFAPFGINISSNMAVRTPFLSGLIDDKSVLESGFGATGGMVKKATGAISATLHGDVWKAIESGSPEAVSNAMRQYRLYDKGQRTASGEPIFFEGKPVKSTATEALLQGAIGLKTQRKAKMAETIATERALESYWNDKKKEYVKKAKEGDRKAQQEFNKMLLKDATARKIVKPITDIRESKPNKLKTMFEKRL